MASNNPLLILRGNIMLHKNTSSTILREYFHLMLSDYIYDIPDTFYRIKPSLSVCGVCDLAVLIDFLNKERYTNLLLINLSKGDYELKKLPFIIIGLILLDQTIKLLILQIFSNNDLTILPNILYVHPVQNTNLNWLASILEYIPPVALIIAIHILVLVTVIFLYRYLFYLWPQEKKLLYGMITGYLSGIACAFIDVVFWGGSLDYIKLFDWFTFDLKDVYLNTGTVFLSIFMIVYEKKIYSKMSKSQRKQAGLWIWLKKEFLSAFHSNRN